MKTKELIKTEIERLYKEEYGTAATALHKLLDFINSLPEEPVSKELESFINVLSKQFPEVSFAKLSRIVVRVAKWQKKQDQNDIEQQTLDFEQELYKAFGQVKDFTLGMRIAKHFYEMGKKSAI